MATAYDYKISEDVIKLGWRECTSNGGKKFCKRLIKRARRRMLKKLPETSSADKE